MAGTSTIIASFLLLSALATSACNSPDQRSLVTSAGVIPENLKQYSDARTVAAHSPLIRREGDTLILAGKPFKDQGDCRSGDCTRYRADTVWHNDYVGIDVSYYEGSDYFLVHQGQSTPLGSRPIPSPSGRRFFTGHHNDSEWTPYQGASVWEWHPHPRRLRVVDTDLVAFNRFTQWHGDSCVEFTGARGFNVGIQPTRTFWLVEHEGDWQLREERPTTCR